MITLLWTVCVCETLEICQREQGHQMLKMAISDGWGFREFLLCFTHFFCLIWILKWLCIIYDNGIKQRFHFGFYKKEQKPLCVSFHRGPEDISDETELVRNAEEEESGLESVGT